MRNLQSWNSREYLNPMLLFLGGTRHWARIALPTDIDRALRGTEVFVVSGKGNGRALFAVRDSTYYELPSGLDQLCVDAGMRLDRTDLPTWMRLYAFFMIGANRIALYDRFLPDVGGAPAVIDSVLDGTISLVPEYDVVIKSLEVAKEKDKGGAASLFTPVGALARVVADVTWTDQRHTVSVTLGGVIGYGKRSFPMEWDDGVYDVWLVLPASPAHKGGSYRLYIDESRSDGYTYHEGKPAAASMTTHFPASPQ